MKKNPARSLFIKKDPSVLLEEINNSINTDARLYEEDIIASEAHCKMLIDSKIIKKSEGKIILSALSNILKNIKLKRSIRL